MEEMTKEIVEKDDNQKGAAMVEYALLVSLMAILLMAVIGVMRTGASTSFSQVGSALTN